MRDIVTISLGPHLDDRGELYEVLEKRNLVHPRSGGSPLQGSVSYKTKNGEHLNLKNGYFYILGSERKLIPAS